MTRIFAGGALRVLFVLAGSAVATFALLWNAPGDPALAIAMARFEAVVSTEVVEQIRAETGLDGGFWRAFGGWVQPLLAGDLGRSSVTGREVLPDLISAIAYTVPLALAGLAIALVIALPLAIVSTRSPGGPLDKLAIAIASLGTAIPAYWLGLLLILLFAVQLHWLPAMGASTPAHIILPATTLGLGVAAALTRIIRSGILEASEQSFLPAFRRRKISERIIARAHIAPHATIPVITVIGLELAFVLEGAVMVEVIFSRPGLGTFLVNAIKARDFPQVQAVVLLAAMVFAVLNLLVDLVYRLIDPRIGQHHA